MPLLLIFLTSIGIGLFSFVFWFISYVFVNLKMPSSHDYGDARMISWWGFALGFLILSLVTAKAVLGL